MKKKRITRKRVAGGISILAAALVLLVGTFAWQDYNQHATNEANGVGSVNYAVHLVEDFKEIENWHYTDAPHKKEIRARNMGGTTLYPGVYDDVFVRVQLKEYMEIADITYEYSDDRYMIDIDGEFYTYPDQVTAEAAHPGHDVVETASYAQKQAGETEFYVKTQGGDENGQYGRHLIIDQKVGDPESLVQGVSRSTDAYEETTHHQKNSNGECDYTVHTWDSERITPFDDYIKWNLGETITIDEWDGSPVDKWILDTDSDEGWAYWGMAIAAGDDTENLMESIELKTQPNGEFYYAIHVDMEAVSLNEMWDDAPDGLTAGIADYEPQILAIAIESDKKSVALGDGVQFKATVKGTSGYSQSVKWTIDSATTDPETKIFSDGYLQVGADETLTSIRVTATSVMDPSYSASKSVNTFIRPTVRSVEITQHPTKLKQGKRSDLTAVVEGDNITSGVEWTVTNPANPTNPNDLHPDTRISETGLLIIGLYEQADQVTVTARSKDANGFSDSVTIEIEPAGAFGLWGGKRDIGEKFEANGLQWMVVDVDENHNLHIVSDKVLDKAAYNATADTVYYKSDLKIHIDTMYADWYELHPFVRMTEFNGTTAATMNGTSIVTSAGIPVSEYTPTGDPDVDGKFLHASPLTQAELTKYSSNTPALQKATDLQDASSTYWLLGAATSNPSSPIYLVNTNGTTSSSAQTAENGIRPALWLNVHE